MIEFGIMISKKDFRNNLPIQIPKEEFLKRFEVIEVNGNFLALLKNPKNTKSLNWFKMRNGDFILSISKGVFNITRKNEGEYNSIYKDLEENDLISTFGYLTIMLSDLFKEDKKNNNFCIKSYDLFLNNLTPKGFKTLIPQLVRNNYFQLGNIINKEIEKTYPEFKDLIFNEEILESNPVLLIPTKYLNEGQRLKTKKRLVNGFSFTIAKEKGKLVIIIKNGTKPISNLYLSK